MSKRLKHIKDKLSIDFFNKKGRLPTKKELEKLLVNNKPEAPLVSPDVPLKGAISNAGYIKKDFNNMLLERRNISDIITDMKTRIARVIDATKAETNNFAYKAGNIIKKYTHSNSDKINYDGDVLPPVTGSHNVSYGGEGVVLERSKIEKIEFRTKINAWTEQQGANPSLRTLSAINPVSLVAIGTKGQNKGARMTLTPKLGDQYISEIRIDSDPCNIKVRLNNDTTDYIDKTINGIENLAIGRIVSSITIILYDTPSTINFRVRELLLYKSTYSGAGTFTTGEYITPPIQIDTTTFKLDPGQHLPDNTSVTWYYAPNEAVDGYFGSPTNTPNANLPYADLVYYDDSTDNGLTYSDVYKYDESISSPLVWTECDINKSINWNGTVTTSFTPDNVMQTDKRHLISIGVIDNNFDGDTLSLGYGYDSFLFCSAQNEGAYLIRTKLKVDETGYIFDFVNPLIMGTKPLFRRLTLKGQDVEEDLNVANNQSFTIDLAEGTYDLMLEFTQDTEFNFYGSEIVLDNDTYTPLEAIGVGYTVLEVIKAFSPTSFDFEQLVSADTMGRKVKTCIYDTIYKKDIDEIVYSKDTSIVEYALDATGRLWVPRFDEAKAIEGYQPILCHVTDASHPYYEKSYKDIYTDDTVKQAFYDISYNVRSNANINEVFLRAVLVGSSSATPIIRSLKVESE